jgi:hypothetical protein
MAAVLSLRALTISLNLFAFRRVRPGSAEANEMMRAIASSSIVRSPIREYHQSQRLYCRATRPDTRPQDLSPLQRDRCCKSGVVHTHHFACIVQWGTFCARNPWRKSAYQNKAVIYDLLFRASAETMLTIAADPKHLGARIGITDVLHSWGSAMTQNPHS